MLYKRDSFDISVTFYMQMYQYIKTIIQIQRYQQSFSPLYLTLSFLLFVKLTGAILIVCIRWFFNAARLIFRFLGAMWQWILAFFQREPFVLSSLL